MPKYTFEVHYTHPHDPPDASGIVVDSIEAATEKEARQALESRWLYGSDWDGLYGPPQVGKLVSVDVVVEACPQCGQALDGADDCANCGVHL